MKILKESKATHIILEGNKNNPEKQTTTIQFPGGYVEVTRTTDNNYWAHIKVNNPNFDGYVLPEAGVLREKYGNIERIRVDTINGVKSLEIPDTDHFAVLISTGNSKNNIQRWVCSASDVNG